MRFQQEEEPGNPKQKPITQGPHKLPSQIGSTLKKKKLSAMDARLQSFRRTAALHFTTPPLQSALQVLKPKP